MRTQVGPYRIRDVLGEGAMGVVYSALDERLNRTIAIKTLGQTRDDVSRARLLREARAAARLSHPGICQVFDVGEEKGELWVAMELLEGETLQSRIEKGRPSVGEAVEIVVGILGPLEYLHSRGLVHRDLKPSNIFLTPHGVKLLDFSLAVGHQVEVDTRVTRADAIVGTPHYMAPEQWRAKDIGPWTDLFACGAILYELLAGGVAFPGDDPIDVYHACAVEEPPPLAGPPGIEPLDAVVRKAIAKAHTERYESARAMAADLTAAHGRYGASSTPAAGSADEATADRIRRFIALPFRVLRPDPEIDFLSDSLPEAISASLAGLEHLVVRSTGLAERGSGRDTDLKTLSRELEVDYALRGSLLSAGSKVRLNAQLVEVPEGTVVWTFQEDVPLGDLFELQDHLVRRVVEGLALPLSPRDRARLDRDVPASPRAYELYLRALHAGGGAFTSTANMSVRDLLRSCLDADPAFAPAWTQYARVCRKIAKFALENPEAHLRLAKEAFERAMALNPESPVLHNHYAFFELEQGGDPVPVMARLLGRVRARVADAELYAGLVAACRFGGLYEASIAAHERGRRLDPVLSTSVHHTYFQVGRMHEVEGHDFLHALGRDDAHALAVVRDELGAPVEGQIRRYLECVHAALEGRVDDCVGHYRSALEPGLDDPEFNFYFGRALSRGGAGPVALEAFERVVGRGFYCPAPLATDRWLEALRAEAGYEALLGRAREGRERALAAYARAGGAELLGVAER